MADDETLRFYAANAKAYAGRARRLPNAQLSAFLAALPAGGAVLELGTGGGQDAAAMLERGFAVTPTDASPELAAEAQKLLGRPVRILKFHQLDYQASFDGVWASAALLHAPAAELPGALALVHRALRPGGMFVASFKAGNGEGRDGLGRYYNYPSLATLQRVYAEAADWSALGITQHSGSGYDNTLTDWLWVTARK